VSGSVGVMIGDLITAVTCLFMHGGVSSYGKKSLQNQWTDYMKPKKDEQKQRSIRSIDAVMIL